LEDLTLAIGSLGTEVVTVRVGSNHSEQTFPVHKALLVRHSEYFAAALSQSWKEGKEGVVTLDRGAAEHFKAFCNFLYTGKIYTIPEGNKVGG
jgi:hypothetical protein